jgi:hypothetical protein
VGSIYNAAEVDVTADVAWDYLDRFTRGEVLPFSSLVAGVADGEDRVFTVANGTQVRERNVTVDPVRRRASYFIVGSGAEHHHAEMRVETDSSGAVTVVWVTDYLPHELADKRAPVIEKLFPALIAAVNAHASQAGAPESGASR